MNSLFKSIDLLCNDHNKYGSYELLSDMILKSIITLHIKSFQCDYIKVCDILGIDVNEVFSSEVFGILNTEVESSVWEIAEVISTSYEYLIKNETFN